MSDKLELKDILGALDVASNKVRVPYINHDHLLTPGSRGRGSGRAVGGASGEQAAGRRPLHGARQGRTWRRQMPTPHGAGVTLAPGPETSSLHKAICISRCAFSLLAAVLLAHPRSRAFTRAAVTSDTALQEAIAALVVCCA